MQQLGRYIIEEELGEGTYARVYRAVDQKLQRRVALEVLKPAWLNDPAAMRRFQKEATSMANLHHPNIVPIFDVGEAEGTVFLSQFLVEGESLAARLAQGPLSWTQTLDIVRGVAAALDYAHAPHSPKASQPVPADLPDTLTITTPFTMEFIRIPAGEFLGGSHFSSF